MRTVGILGGMGPEATVLLMQRVLGAVRAADDADHIPLIVHQNPQVPSRIRWLIDGGGVDPGPALAQMARDLQAAGARALAMPCNTAHAFAQQIVVATPLPFLDMRSATLERLRVALPIGGRIGMLASPALRQTGAFDSHFAAAAVTAVWPLDEAPTLALIRAVKTGDTGPAAHRALADLAAALALRCDQLLVACTKLSLLTDALPPSGWTDSLDCLTSAIVDFARADVATV